MKFQRCGGLSRRNQKAYYKRDSFHSPPARKGVYAFMYPHTETFLVLWNDQNIAEFKRKGWRTFDYEGYVWCHFVDHTKSAKRKKDWVCVHTDELEKILKKVYSEAIASRRDRNFWGGWSGKTNLDFEYSKQIYRPYNICIDHWEVFIEDRI